MMGPEFVGVILFYANQVEFRVLFRLHRNFTGSVWKVLWRRKKSKWFWIWTTACHRRHLTSHIAGPGTGLDVQVIDDYERLSKAVKHADGYPTPGISPHNYESRQRRDTKGKWKLPQTGSELIRIHDSDDDARIPFRCGADAIPLPAHYWYWKWIPRKSRNGAAFMTGSWIKSSLPPAESRMIHSGIYRREWPGILFVKTLQMQSYAYPWSVMPEGEERFLWKAGFMKAEIINGKVLWRMDTARLDGHVYMKGKAFGQFDQTQYCKMNGSAQDLFRLNSVWYDFIRRGFAYVFFCLLDFGFRTLENFWLWRTGRQILPMKTRRIPGRSTLQCLECREDKYTGRDGNTSEQESMWPYICRYPERLRGESRLGIKDKKEDAEHMPRLKIEEGLILRARPGGNVVLHAKAATEETSAAGIL